MLFNTPMLLTIPSSTACGSGNDSFRAPDSRNSNAFFLALPINIIIKNFIYSSSITYIDMIEDMYITFVIIKSGIFMIQIFHRIFIFDAAYKFYAIFYSKINTNTFFSCQL